MQSNSKRYYVNISYHNFSSDYYNSYKKQIEFETSIEGLKFIKLVKKYSFSSSNFSPDLARIRRDNINTYTSKIKTVDSTETEFLKEVIYERSNINSAIMDDIDDYVTKEVIKKVEHVIEKDNTTKTSTYIKKFEKKIYSEREYKINKILNEEKI